MFERFDQSMGRRAFPPVAEPRFAVSLWRPTAAFRRCAGETLVTAKGLASPAIKAPNAWHIGVDLNEGQR